MFGKGLSKQLQILRIKFTYLDKVRHWSGDADISFVVFVCFDIIFYSLPSDSRKEKRKKLQCYCYVIIWAK